MYLITEHLEDLQYTITEGKNGVKETYIEGVFMKLV